MCVLSYDEIITGVVSGELDIDPFFKGCVQPASYDLALGTTFWRMSGGTRNKMTPLSYDLSKLAIGPKEFMLACTMERVRLGSGLVGRIEGRSSIGRRGLMIENAGYVDPGWDGVLTLELFNASDEWIPLEIGGPIAHITFMRMSRHPTVLYGDKRLGSHYKGATDAELSKLVMEFEK